MNPIRYAHVMAEFSCYGCHRTVLRMTRANVTADGRIDMQSAQDYPGDTWCTECLTAKSRRQYRDLRLRAKFRIGSKVVVPKKGGRA